MILLVEVIGYALPIVGHDVVAVFPHPVCQGAACLSNVPGLTSGADDQVYNVGHFACEQGLWVEGGTQWGGDALCEGDMSTGAAPGGPTRSYSRAP